MEIKGQLKIQEMAFVLVAIVIFFSLVALIFFSIKINSIKEDATLLSEEKAAALVKHISGIPELSWNCAGCIDLDKAMALRNLSNQYLFDMLELDYLMIEILYPINDGSECILGKYPSCSKLYLLDKKENFGVSSSAYVNLCRWSSEKGQEICTLGKIYASGKGVSNE